MPDPAHFDRDEQLQIRSLTDDSAVPRPHSHDRDEQSFIRQTITLDATGVRLAPFAMHCLWPEQIDELAVRAGLRLTERWADRDRSPFGPHSRSHISVYCSAGEPSYEATLPGT